jgi:RNA polymerase sigma factor (sigma-70 family)
LADAESRLAALMSGYRRMVRSAIARAGGRTLRDSRDDIEQQVWVAIWRRLQGEQEIDHPTSYLYTVARREAMRAVEEELTRVRHTEALPEPAPRPSDDPDRVLVSKQTDARVRAALAQLSPDRRRSFPAVLKGLYCAEILYLFCWYYARARTLIARGRADMRKLLEEDR